MKDLPTWSDLNKGVRKMTDKEFEECEQAERLKHDEKVRELEANKCFPCKYNTVGQDEYIAELEEQTREQEKENERLAKHILELQADKGRLTDEVDTLKLQISELIKQRQYWKDSSFDWRHKFFKKRLVKRLVAKDKQLTEAKSLLAKWVELYKPKSNTVLPTPIQVATEQFLKEQINENN